MNRGIKFKLFLFFSGFIFLIGSAIGVTIWMVKAQRKDSSVINLGGVQRMLTQQMSKDALALSLGVEPARERLAKDSKAFDMALKSLINGGAVTDSGNREIEIPPTVDPETLAQLRKLNGHWGEFYKNIKVMLDKDADIAAFAASAKFIEEHNMALLKEVSAAGDMYADLSARKTSILIITQIAVFFISIAIAVIGLIILTRIIVRPVSQIVGMAKAVAAGDLTARRLDFKNRDEMGMLGGAVNKMKDNLSVIISNIGTTSSNVADTAVQLSSYSTKMVHGAENQSSRTTDVAGAMEEMSATVIEIVRNSQTAAESAKLAQDTAVNGGEVVSMAVQGMMTVAATVKSSAATVETLGKSSEEIGGIVTVINDIADQTNLLALNAAIEAARAGEQGRGFAVVADEVRKLAEKTTKATKQIADMIQTIQNDTRGVMTSMNEGTRQAESGVRLANDAGEALKQIVSSVQKVTNLVSLIASAAEEQSSTTDSIAISVTEIAGVAKDALEGIKQISMASENLSAVSARLQDIIGAFRLSKEETVQTSPFSPSPLNKGGHRGVGRRLG